MISAPLSGRVQGDVDVEYGFAYTRLTKRLAHTTVAELKLLCSVMAFDRWVSIPDEFETSVRHAYIELGYVASLKAYRPKRIVIHEVSGEVLVEVVGPMADENAVLRTQRNEQKLYRSLEAVENDLLEVLRPDNGAPVVCAVTMRALSRVPSRAESAKNDKRKPEKSDPPDE